MANKLAAKKSTPKRASKASAKVPALPQRKCGCMSVHYWLLEQYPEYRAAQSILEHSVFASRRMAKTAPTKPSIINVVVHVLESPGAGKVTAAQVDAQIKVLNEDYRAKNLDKSNVPAVWQGMVADAMIQFQLATKDPNGNKADGLVYVPTIEPIFGQNDSMKDPARGGSAAWPTDRYLNIWVCPLKDGLLGYAQFPGGPPTTDGVVISLNAFGIGGTAQRPFDKGRTCTHEIGHYFNLRHIWGDTPDCSGGDSVDDTPNAEGPNYNTPTFPKVSCQNGPNGEMFMNYMDYVNDEAMFMFTPQQVSRMRTTLDGPRMSLWS